MRGVMFQSLKEFLKDKVGPGAWGKAVKEAGVDTTLYVSVKSYPNSELMSLIAGSAKVMGVSVQGLMEEFGAHMALNYFQTRSYLFRPEWGLLDSVEHLKEFIFKTAHLEPHPDPDLEDLNIVVTRDSPTQATTHYRSPRKLCGIWKGCIRGAAIHYGNEIELTEPICMLHGDDECEIIVKVIGGSQKKPIVQQFPPKISSPDE